MNGHQRHHSAADLGYNSSNDSADYPSFKRNAMIRASTGNLKLPRLPGSEKFRFSHAETTVGHQPIISRSSTLPSGRKSQRITSCASAILSSYNFSDSRRKPILPISKNTSRVLNNVNVELTADTVEFIQQEPLQLTNICNKYLSDGTDHTEESTSDEWSRSSSDQSLEKEGRFLRHSIIIQPNPPSVSTVNTCSPEIGQQELHGNRNQYASIRSNRLRMRTPRLMSSSASQSTISSDEDIWIPRSASLRQ